MSLTVVPQTGRDGVALLNTSQTSLPEFHIPGSALYLKQDIAPDSHPRRIPFSDIYDTTQLGIQRAKELIEERKAPFRRHPAAFKTDIAFTSGHCAIDALQVFTLLLSELQEYLHEIALAAYLEGWTEEGQIQLWNDHWIVPLTQLATLKMSYVGSVETEAVS